MTRLDHLRVSALFWLDRLRRSWLQNGGWPYLLVVGLLLASSLFWATYYPGIASLFGRDQGYGLGNSGPITAGNMTYTHLVPYKDYPLEYPFVGGLLMFVVNLVGYSVRPALQSLWLVVYSSSFMMGACACFIAIVWARAKVPAYKALLLFALNPAVLDQFDVNFDMAAALFLLLSVYWLARGRRGPSAVALALSAGVKGFPFVALPLLAWYAGRGQPGDRGLLSRHESRNYLATSLGVFGGGMAAQYLLSPTNFLRAGSYLTAYGVEGSWLGLLFPRTIINYQDWSTWSAWIPGGSTLLHLPQPYQLASAALIGLSLLLIWRKRRDLAPKTAVFLAVSAVVLFWWWSPPQFLYYPLALLPLLARDFKVSLAMAEGVGLFGNFTLWIRVPLQWWVITSYDWVLISIGYQACLGAWILWEWRRGSLWRPKMDAHGSDDKASSAWLKGGAAPPMPRVGE